MSVQVIKRSKHLSNKWAGGTTTQLFIYPETSEYQKKDFLFRISTATVEVDRSDFTALPGFHRKLMVLKGDLTIHHKDNYSRTLKKFEQDEFDGGWETTADGKVIDFNLMMTSGVEGSLEHMVMDKGQKIPIEMDRFSFIYLFAGELEVKDQKISERDLVVIDRPMELTMFAKEICEVVICSVKAPVKDSAS